MSVGSELRVAESREWVGLTGLFAFASFSEIVLYSNLNAFTPLFLQDLGFDAAGVKAWTGILASASLLIGFWFVPFWGVLADRYGRKPLIVRSFVVEVVAVIVIALAPNVWFFLLGRMVTGLALGNTGLMFASVSERVPRARVGVAIATITGSQPVGGVLGSLMGGFIVSQFGVTALWWFNCALIAAVTLMLVLFYHEPFTPRPTPPIRTMLENALRAVATTPIVVKYFLFSFIATSAFFFSYAYISTRIIELAHALDAGVTIGLVFGIAGIAALFATPIWGTLADRYGHEKLLPLVTFLTAAAYIPLFFASTVTQFTIAYFALSSVSPAINSLTFAIIGLGTPPDRRNAVMSMVFMPLNAAIVVAPLLASVMTREIREVFLYSSIISFTAFALLMATRGFGQSEAGARGARSP